MSWFDIVKAKVFYEVVIPILCLVAMIIILFIIGFIGSIKDDRKEKLVFKHGFHAEEYVGFDNQHHTKYVKDGRTITEAEFNSLSYKQLKHQLNISEPEVK